MKIDFNTATIIVSIRKKDSVSVVKLGENFHVEIDAGGHRNVTIICTPETFEDLLATLRAATVPEEVELHFDGTPLGG